MQLSAFQDGFAAALRCPHHGIEASDPPAWMQALVAQPGFAVYRNNNAKATQEALRANYPTVLSLVGDDWFAGAARAFVAEHPPSDGRLMRYGSEFPIFLQGFAPAAELPYLASVASLDLAWTRSHLAADTPVLQADWMASLTAETFSSVRVAPHPAAQWHWSAEHPSFSIWQRHRDGAPLDAPLQWQPEGALLTRPGPVVQWCALPATGVAFLNACAAGAGLQDAALAAVTPPEHASRGQPPPDLAALIALLLGAGALCIAPSHKEKT